MDVQCTIVAILWSQNIDASAERTVSTDNFLSLEICCKAGLIEVPQIQEVEGDLNSYFLKIIRQDQNISEHTFVNSTVVWAYGYTLYENSRSHI